MASGVATPGVMTAAETSGNVLIFDATIAQVMSADLETADI
jgi:hypothetical protein